jgi:hypothetical protein
VTRDLRQTGPKDGRNSDLPAFARIPDGPAEGTAAVREHGHEGLRVEIRLVLAGLGEDREKGRLTADPVGDEADLVAGVLMTGGHETAEPLMDADLQVPLVDHFSIPLRTWPRSRSAFWKLAAESCSQIRTRQHGHVTADRAMISAPVTQTGPLVNHAATVVMPLPSAHLDDRHEALVGLPTTNRPQPGKPR